MLTFREIRPEDREIVVPMVVQFYTTDAVDHPVPQKTLERAFEAVADPGEPMARGLLMLEDDTPVGYLYLSPCYSCEVGGLSIWVEELFVLKEFQGRGYGKRAMEHILEEYPDCRRIRLEVTQVNQRAIRLYEKCGFTYLRYDQMVLDRVD